MIDFTLTDEQRLLEQSVREWASREVAPYIRENDRTHHFDRDRILGGMARLGLLGISVPQEYGGAGMDYICLGLASEELEYVDTSLRVIMSVHAGLNSLSLLTWGTEEQKQKYLVPRASLPAAGSVSPYVASLSPCACGTRYFCFCSSVPQVSSDRLLRPA